ncbi:MAG: hypothetical protein HQM16_14635 [Deltaproteobacteria bacterium]|nr:hypothetical protein [Deltaproteobacteria bacterium]
MIKKHFNKTVGFLLNIFVMSVICADLAYAVPAGSTEETIPYALAGVGGSSSSGGGQTVQADEFTGAATYSVSLPVPPARGAIEPQINLHYNSYRKDPNSWVGYGWELDVGYIERTPKSGIIDYTEGHSFQIKLGSVSESLRLISSNLSDSALSSYGIEPTPNIRVDEYQAKIESAFNIYLHLRTVTDTGVIKDKGWIIIDKSGTRYYLGSTAAGREETSRCTTGGTTTCASKRVAKWYLESVVDASNNRLAVTYGADKRIQTVKYQDIVVEFNRSAETFNYYPVSRDGFLSPAKITARLDNIIIKKNETRLQKILFNYTVSGFNGFHFLKSLTQYGTVDENQMPPTEFTYYGQSGLEWSSTPYAYQASTTRPRGGALYNNGFIDYDTQFADMNGDGLLDKVVAYETDTSLFVYYNNGSDFVYDAHTSEWADPLWSACTTGASDCRGKINSYNTSDGVERQYAYLMDINGDSLPDRVREYSCADCPDPTRQKNFEIYFNKGGRWESPGVSWRDPYVGEYSGLSDNERFFMDMNGDGLVDRVIGDPDSKGFNVYYNTGAGFKNTPVFWVDPVSKVSEDDSDSIGKQTGSIDSGKKTKAFIRDFNGDGLPDRMFQVRITTSSTADGGAGYVQSISADGTSIVTGFAICLNRNGMGWVQPSPDGTGGSMLDGANFLGVVDDATADMGFNTKTQDWIDFNADGYLDRVVGNKTRGTFKVYFYKGMKTGSLISQLSAALEFEDRVTDVGSDFSGVGHIYNVRTPPSDEQHTSGYWSTHTMIIDINGDGYPDRVTLNPRNFTKNDKDYQVYLMRVNTVEFSDSPTRWVNKLVTQPVGALKDVNNGQGMRTVIEYSPTSWPRRWLGTGGQYPATHKFLPFNMYVAHKVYFLDYNMPVDTVAEAAEKPHMRWTTYNYFGGNFLVHYAKKATADSSDDTVSRSHASTFNGFQKITKQTYQTSSEAGAGGWNNITSTMIYYQTQGDVDSFYGLDESALFERSAYSHYAFSGKPYMSTIEEASGGKVQEVSNYTIDLTTPPDDFTCDRVCFPRLKSHTKTVYENLDAPSRVTKIETDYDAYGNVTSETYKNKTGEVLLIKETEYYGRESFDTKLQIRDRPRLQVKRTTGETGTILRKKEFVYNSQGLPLEERVYKDDLSYATITRTYNPDGTLKTMTDVDGVTKTLTYDVDGLFPLTEKMTSPAGTDLTVSRGFNRLSGQPDIETASSGVSTTKTYDDFSRLLAEYIVDASGLTRTLVKSYKYEYIDATINDVATKLLKTSVLEPHIGYPDTETTPMTIAYADASGYVLQQCGYSEKGGQYRASVMRLSKGGQVEYKTEPFITPDCAFQSAIPTGVALYRTVKDFQGRVLEQESPAGDAGSPVSRLTYSYVADVYGQMSKTTRDSAGNTTTEVYDINERLVKVVDPMGNQMQYQYNPVGDLLTVTKDGGLITSLTYDYMGRKTSMTDANLGTWTYEYDTQNRLYRQTDHAGNYSIHTYDSIGRTTRTDYYTPDYTLEKYLVSYYDSGDATHNVINGELYKVEEYDGVGALKRATRFGYETGYRRNNKITRTITGLADFEQTFEYDVYGALKSTTYPGGINLYYQYNRTGALEKMCSTPLCDTAGEVYYSIDSATDYDNFGSLLAERYGNGVVKNYSYYPNSHRLQGMTLTQGTQKYSDRSYEYDIYSNITRLGDNLDLTGTGGLSSVSYDVLSRLTGYTKQGTSRSDSLTYDAQGNILTNTAQYGTEPYVYEAPAYAPALPHAVKRIGARRFTYDDNGNMLTDPDRTMTYNAQNQLVRVVMRNGNIVEYDYDYTGGRVSKRVSRLDAYHHMIENTVYYLGDAIEIKDNKLFVNIFAGNKKVAVRCLGSLDAIIGGSGATLRPVGMTPELRLASCMPALLMGLALLLMVALRPVSNRYPAWARRLMHLQRYNPCYLTQGRGVVFVIKKQLFLILELYRRVATVFQESVFALPHNLAAKMVTFLLVLSFAISAPILQAHAWETGPSVVGNVSDEQYFFYVHGDHLGSTHIITEGNKDGGRHAGVVYPQGSLLQRIEYDPFGKESYVLNPNLNTDPSFTGQKYDIESGLYYYKSRYYNPQIGRFVQPDTVVPSATDYQSFNRYAYVRNNPLKYVDPSGHSFWSWFKKIVGAFLGALVAVVVGIATAGLGPIIAGALAGLAGGLLNGAITGGLKGALMGGLTGLIAGALGGAASFGLSSIFTKGGGLVTFAVFGAIGLGLSVHHDGWKGLVTFGAGLLGAYAGGKMMGRNIFDFSGGSRGGTGGAGPNDASIGDVIESTDYGPFDRKFNSVEELGDSLNEGDVVFGKRPLSWAKSMGGTSQADNLNLDLAHEHVFWKENGMLMNKGFRNTGLFSESRVELSRIIQGYRFGPTLHHGNMSAMNSVFSTYRNIGYNPIGPNCQDFSDSVRESLY